MKPKETENPTKPLELYNLTNTVDPVVNVIDTEPDALAEIEAEWSRKKIRIHKFSICRCF